MTDPQPSKIRNTTKDTREALLLAGLVGSSEMIHMQEKRGQCEVAASQSLPRKGLSDLKKMLDHFGFRFVGNIEGDDLFANFVFPEVWKLGPTDHSMWSKLRDPQGRARASIFYKAAFYDRDAHISANPRFTVTSKMVDEDSDRWYPAIIDSLDAVVWAGNPGIYESCRGVADGIIKATAYDPTSFDWDTPVEFPPSLYVEPKGDNYRFFISFVNDGRVVDSGHHTTRKFENDEAAVTWWLDKGIKRIAGAYDSVTMDIRCGDRVVKVLKTETSAGRRKSRVRRFEFNGIDFDERGNPYNR
jgi:hypothetical protein